MIDIILSPNLTIKTGTNYPLIDFFSKSPHMIPLMSKTGTGVRSAFLSIYGKPKYYNNLRSRRRPVSVRTEKCVEFLNRQFQAALRREDITFQLRKNRDVKSNVVEQAHRTIRDNFYKYFTYKNTLRYMEDFPKISQRLQLHGSHRDGHGAVARDRFGYSSLDGE